MVLMSQVVQSRSVCLEHRGYAMNIGPRTHTSLGDLVPGLPEPTDRSTKAKSPGWDPGSQSQGHERTVEQQR